MSVSTSLQRCMRQTEQEHKEEQVLDSEREYFRSQASVDKLVTNLVTNNQLDLGLVTVHLDHGINTQSQVCGSSEQSC